MSAAIEDARETEDPSAEDESTSQSESVSDHLNDLVALQARVERLQNRVQATNSAVADDGAETLSELALLALTHLSRR